MCSYAFVFLFMFGFWVSPEVWGTCCFMAGGWGWVEKSVQEISGNAGKCEAMAFSSAASDARAAAAACHGLMVVLLEGMLIL